jgi:starch synthase
MNVLFVTPECAPVVKTGGLGDVSAALPEALRRIGLDARVLLPGYPSVLAADPKAREAARFSLFPAAIAARLLESRLPSGVPLYIVDCPALYVRGGGPYQRDDGHEWEDNALRFGVLSKVAAMLGSGDSPIEWRADVVHCNDWQASLAPVYLRYSIPPRAGSLVTIHNLAFQGIYPAAQVTALGLPAETLGFEGLEYYGQLSFLHRGLMYADAITRVSPSFAREIQTEALGFGLDGVLRHRSAVLYGVRNGIDTKLWDPRTDPNIARNYSAATLDDKLENKRALRKELQLAGDDSIPVLGLVSRLTHQKGIDVIAQAAHAIAALPAHIVALGTGDREMVGAMQAVRSRHPHEISVTIGFDETMAHRIEAGCDLFLMPSRFEPCGMNQMYSQRYGTLPIGNATGGLVDTIDDGETGFLIDQVTLPALVGGLKRALAAYQDATRWRKMQVTAMARDFGWEGSAREYAAIYARITAISSGPSRSGA